jgi:hypothetical protein
VVVPAELNGDAARPPAVERSPLDITLRLDAIGQSAVAVPGAAAPDKESTLVCRS